MYKKEEIFKQLEELCVPKDSAVTLHISLKAVGETEGRAEGLLKALIEYCTAEGGLLCVPTHTWANVKTPEKVTLDLKEGGTCIGTLPDIASRHPAAHRSLHPTHSMAVFGEASKAEAFIEGDKTVDTPTSPHGCYGNIFQNNGYVLLVGVGHNRNTYLHCVEEMLGVDNRLSKEAHKLSIRHKSGEIEPRFSHSHFAEGLGNVAEKYPKYDPAFRYHGCIKDGYLGSAKAMLCSAVGMKNVMELVRKRTFGAEILADDTPLDKKLYI